MAAKRRVEIGDADEEAARKRRKQEKRRLADEAAQAAELEAAELEARAARKKKRKEERQADAEAADAVIPAEDEKAARKALKKEKKRAAAEAEELEAAELDAKAARKKKRNEERQTAAAAEDDAQEQAATGESAVQQSTSRKILASEDRDACRVLVGSLQPEVTEALLRSQFEYCGEINNVYVVTDKWTGDCKGVGFITFADSDGAAEALKANGSYFRARLINVSMAERKDSKGKGKGKDKGKGKGKTSSKTTGQRPANCTGVVVKQLAYTATQADLEEAFKSCGAGPEKVKVLYDKYTGHPKGMAFVEFLPEGGEVLPDAVDVGKSVDAAVRLSGGTLKGRTFYVEYNCGV